MRMMWSQFVGHLDPAAWWQGIPEGQTWSSSTGIWIRSRLICVVDSNQFSEGTIPEAREQFCIYWCHPQHYPLPSNIPLYLHCERLMETWCALLCGIFPFLVGYSTNLAGVPVTWIISSKDTEATIIVFSISLKCGAQRSHLWSSWVIVTMHNGCNQGHLHRIDTYFVLVASASCNVDTLPHGRIPKTLGTCAWIGENPWSVPIWFLVRGNAGWSHDSPKFHRLSQDDWMPIASIHLVRISMKELDNLSRR